MKVSHIFKDEQEVLNFILKEVRRYTGCYSDDHRVLYSYNRLTVEELAQEVILKLLRSVRAGSYNKAYVRQAVSYVCIDEYRRYRLYDLEFSKSSESQEHLVLEQDEVFDSTDRELQLDMFTEDELPIVLLLLEGKRNPEVRKELNIPKMSYYAKINKIKSKYLVLQGE